MSVQAFPVRFAETVNKFGAPRAERLGATSTSQSGAPALVTIGNRSFVARAHGERLTRRGRQTLVSVHGRLRWVDSRRVQALEGDVA